MNMHGFILLPFVLGVVSSFSTVNYVQPDIGRSEYYGAAIDNDGCVYLASYPCSGDCVADGRVRLSGFEDGDHRAHLINGALSLSYRTRMGSYSGWEPFVVHNDFLFDRIRGRWYLVRGNVLLRLSSKTAEDSKYVVKSDIQLPIMLTGTRDNADSPFQHRGNFSAEGCTKE